MFIEEIKNKLDFSTKLLPYAVSVIGEDGAFVSGVKKVLSTSNEQIVFRASRMVKVVGVGLSIVEIGGGDVFLKGVVTRVEIE